MTKAQEFIPKIYSYVLRYDDGAAPNPFGGTCTLTICKPDIRLAAREGHWVVGTGSTNSRLKDGNIYNFSKCIVYAMKVTNRLSLEEYDEHCKFKLRSKLPKWRSKKFSERMGDCVIDFQNAETPLSRMSVHNQPGMPRALRDELLKKDLRGGNALLSSHFYYFGEDPKILPRHLECIIKKGQKHLIVSDLKIIRAFEDWIARFPKNRILADPQLKYQFDYDQPEGHQIACAKNHLED